MRLQEPDLPTPLRSQQCSGRWICAVCVSALVGFHLSAHSSPQPGPGQSGVNLRMPSIKGTSGSMFLFCSALAFSPTHCSSSLSLPFLQLKSPRPGLWPCSPRRHSTACKLYSCCLNHFMEKIILSCVFFASCYVTILWFALLQSCVA